ncbi:rho-associated protein kinase 2 [Micropterus dolomieu]|uniref:rho-associated protein kinase 2 n=1 Tax=Micropterus dolomieu TaxID=147949 RepID=UPI001E8EEE81|nr:rho-associated protein kinase 2 [Micropterus dolomieu]
MKLSVALAVLCVAVMAVMIYQTLRQELNLRNLKTRTMQNSAEVKTKEEAIVQVKNALNEMKAKLASVNTKIGELKKTRVATEKSTQELDTSLQTCNTEKVAAEKKNAEKAEALAKLTADHENAKKTSGEEIQSLKQQILDRDKAICAFADTTKEEARKLCGIPEAQQ